MRIHPKKTAADRRNRQSRRPRRHPPRQRLPPQPLYALAERLTRYLAPDRPYGNNRRLNEDLVSLSGGRKMFVHEYHVRKIYDLLRISVVLFFACAVCLVCYVTQDRTIPDGKLPRPGYGELAKTEELSLAYAPAPNSTQKDDPADLAGTLQRIPVEIAGRTYTSDQVEELLTLSQEEALQLLPGENASTDEVRRPLRLRNVYGNGAVRAEWTMMPYGVIGETGQIEAEIPEEGVIVTLEADLSCQGQHRICQAAVKVFPPDLGAEEQALQVVEKEIRKADEQSRQEEFLQLPARVDGRPARWLYARDNTALILLLLLLSLPFFLSALKDQRIREQAEARRQQLEMDYPDLMWKMTLLIGAGMNLSAAFARIAGDYRKEKEKTGMHYVYEEMLQTCNEIRDGASEGTAYENFGHRCGLPRYIRIGSVLSQSLRKGSRGLASVLEQEALSTSSERRSQARKLGEKAGTKLLIPMTMMLGIVLVILVVPAFLSL